jgi:hypothetical protein
MRWKVNGGALNFNSHGQGQHFRSMQSHAKTSIALSDQPRCRINTCSYQLIFDSGYCEIKILSSSTNTPPAPIVQYCPAKYGPLPPLMCIMPLLLNKTNLSYNRLGNPTSAAYYPLRKSSQTSRALHHLPQPASQIVTGPNADLWKLPSLNGRWSRIAVEVPPPWNFGPYSTKTCSTFAP